MFYTPTESELYSFMQPQKNDLSSRASWGLKPEDLEDEPVTLDLVDSSSHCVKKKHRKYDTLLKALIALAVVALGLWVIYWLVNTRHTVMSRKKERSKVKLAQDASLAANKSAQNSLNSNSMKMLTSENSNNSNSNSDSTIPSFTPASGVVHGRPSSIKNGLLYSQSANLIPMSKDGCIYGGLGKHLCIGCQPGSSGGCGTGKCPSTFTPYRSTSHELRGQVGEFYSQDPFVGY